MRGTISRGDGRVRHAQKATPRRRNDREAIFLLLRVRWILQIPARIWYAVPAGCKSRLGQGTSRSVDLAGHELQLAVAFDLQNQLTVGFGVVYEHTQAVDASHREAVHRMNHVAGYQRHVIA